MRIATRAALTVLLLALAACRFSDECKAAAVRYVSLTLFNATVDEVRADDDTEVEKSIPVAVPPPKKCREQQQKPLGSPARAPLMAKRGETIDV